MAAPKFRFSANKGARRSLLTPRVLSSITNDPDPLSTDPAGGPARLPGRMPRREDIMQMLHSFFEDSKKCPRVFRIKLSKPLSDTAL